jgi:hypothetical protein
MTAFDALFLHFSWCFLRLLELPKAITQNLQLYGLAPVCTRLWRLRLDEHENKCPQNGHG